MPALEKTVMISLPAAPLTVTVSTAPSPPPALLARSTWTPALDSVGPAEIVDHDVVDAAQCLESDQLDVVEVHGDIGDVADEAHAPAVGRDVDVLGDVGAVEVEPVQAVLALDGVVAVARIPLEDVVAGAEESDVVARAAVDDIVTAATVKRVGAGQSEQDVSAVVAGQNVALVASKQVLDAAQRVARGAAATEAGCQIDADGERGETVADGVDANASSNDIAAAPAVEKVVAAAADQHVVSAAALEGHVRRIIGQIDRQGLCEPLPSMFTIALVTAAPSTVTCRASMACAAIAPSVRLVAPLASLMLSMPVDLAEVGIRHGDRAGKRQRIDAVAAGHTQKAGIGDDQGVVARAAAQHVGAAIADEDVVAEPAHHVVGGAIADQDVGRGGAQMRDVVDRIADSGRAEQHVAVAGLDTGIAGAVASHAPMMRSSKPSPLTSPAEDTESAGVDVGPPSCHG